MSMSIIYRAKGKKYSISHTSFSGLGTEKIDSITEKSVHSLKGGMGYCFWFDLLVYWYVSDHFYYAFTHTEI